MAASNDINITFAARVKQYRRQIGISQEELADRAGLHRTYISDVERAARNVTLKSAARIAEGLGQPLTSLVETEP